MRLSSARSRRRCHGPGLLRLIQARALRRSGAGAKRPNFFEENHCYARYGKLNQIFMPFARDNATTIRTLLAEAESLLASGPHPERARRDAETLLLLALRTDVPGATRAWLIAHDDEVVAPNVVAVMDGLVKRRFAGEPMQYIIGEADFYGLSFRVNRDVLIPRPETEHLVEKAISLAVDFAQPRIVDVGTGSGAIAIALARNLAGAQNVSTEISNAALSLARENAKRNQVADRVRLGLKAICWSRLQASDSISWFRIRRMSPGVTATRFPWKCATTSPRRRSLQARMDWRFIAV